ncbi:hypothetical protein PQJ75_09000 [Rhodoplanes sp. TEM]|uniref:Uncharacterized protein n=1 Tax=Rhodoplanes tepidamans TaxID=200616 RepID=A0ABT5JL60_RHOTP|nr:MULTISPECIES: hypothetical protein [Rhodoplanes]MDC7789993.1 hypothetical protein [Rhodoplanes tepidamans]MDC7983865.1 hypothetical protein [Rhodoplanes sp. TEM]MDQ0354302.1 hypothetical protein [Rhodoplanes tepidamans]
MTRHLGPAALASALLVVASASSSVAAPADPAARPGQLTVKRPVQTGGVGATRPRLEPVPLTKPLPKSPTQTSATTSAATPSKPVKPHVLLLPKDSIKPSSGPAAGPAVGPFKPKFPLPKDDRVGSNTPAGPKKPDFTLPKSDRIGPTRPGGPLSPTFPPKHSGPIKPGDSTVDPKAPDNPLVPKHADSKPSPNPGPLPCIGNTPCVPGPNKGQGQAQTQPEVGPGPGNCVTVRGRLMCPPHRGPLVVTPLPVPVPVPVYPHQTHAQQQAYPQRVQPQRVVAQTVAPRPVTQVITPPQQVAAPASAPLVCSSGGQMSAEVTGATQVTLRFAPGSSAGTSTAPQPGECTWLDRGFATGEPAVLMVGNDASQTAYIVDGVKSGGTFYAHAYNNGSALVVTKVGL